MGCSGLTHAVMGHKSMRWQQGSLLLLCTYLQAARLLLCGWIFAANCKTRRHTFLGKDIHAAAQSLSHVQGPLHSSMIPAMRVRYTL